MQAPKVASVPLYEKLHESNQLAEVSRAVRAASASKPVEVESPSLGRSSGRRESTGHIKTGKKSKVLQPGQEEQERLNESEATAPEGEAVGEHASVGEGAQQRTEKGAEGSSEAEHREAAYKDSVIRAFGGDLEALRQQEEGSSQPKLIALALNSTWKSFSPREQRMFGGTISRRKFEKVTCAQGSGIDQSNN